MANVKFFFYGVMLVFSSFGLSMVSSSWWYNGGQTRGQVPIYSAVLFLITGFLVLLGFLYGFLLIFISSQRVSKHHSIISALHFFIVKYHRLYVGSRRLNKFKSACKNPREAQTNLLQEIMKQNKDTDYGRQFQLGQIQSLEDFRKKHPITEYDHYKAFLDRVSKGDKHVMTSYEVSRLVLTSGTTGSSKLIPQDEYAVDDYLIIQEAFQQEMFPDLQPMQPKLKVHINSQIKRSEGGITVAAATTLEGQMTKRYIIYTPPPEGQMISTVHEAFYVDLLFALREKQLGSIWLTFSSVLVDLLKFLEANWLTLVDDLSNGTIRSDLKLNHRIRTTLTWRLGSGDPARAMEVKQEFEKGFEGIIKRLWPNCRFIACIDVIGFRYHFKEHYSDGIEMYTPMYVCSEALLGLNLWPFEDGKTEYALNLTENIYEFIKTEDWEKENPTTYFVDEVEIDQEYELLISQKYGIYRFRFGDVVKVTGFYQNCPKITFLYRTATILNLVGEKVDQEVVRDSLNDALSKWKDQVTLKHYACAENSLVPDKSKSQKIGLCYVFFLELRSETGEKLPIGLTPETLAKENLYERHKFYSVFVNTGQIKTPEVYLTKEGGFLALKEYILANGTASRAQFKMPVKLRRMDMAQILLDNLLPQ